MSEYIVILCTVPDEKTGHTIAKKLLEPKLAACVTLSSASQSLYWWQGKIEKATEYLLLIKTRASLFFRVEKAILASHPYDVPEIIALDISAGNAKYLEWISKET